MPIQRRPIPQVSMPRSTSRSAERRRIRAAVNVADLLRAAAARYPDRPARDRATAGTRTWAELDTAADAGAVAAAALGVGRGERVVIALPTGADLAAALFAVARAGLIAVPTDAGCRRWLRWPIGSAPSPRSAATRDRRLGISLGAADLADWWSARRCAVRRASAVARTWPCWRAPAVTGR